MMPIETIKSTSWIQNMPIRGSPPILVQDLGKSQFLRAHLNKFRYGSCRTLWERLFPRTRTVTAYLCMSVPLDIGCEYPSRICLCWPFIFLLQLIIVESQKPARVFLCLFYTSYTIMDQGGVESLMLPSFIKLCCCLHSLLSFKDSANCSCILFIFISALFYSLCSSSAKMM